MAATVPGAERHRGDSSRTQTPNLVGKLPCPPPTIGRAAKKEVCRGDDWWGEWGVGASQKRGPLELGLEG